MVGSTRWMIKVEKLQPYMEAFYWYHPEGTTNLYTVLTPSIS